MIYSFAYNNVYLIKATSKTLLPFTKLSGASAVQKQSFKSRCSSNIKIVEILKKLPLMSWFFITPFKLVAFMSLTVV